MIDMSAAPETCLPPPRREADDFDKGKRKALTKGCPLFKGKGRILEWYLHSFVGDDILLNRLQR
jgi:hypothetical protein